MEPLGFRQLQNHLQVPGVNPSAEAIRAGGQRAASLLISLGKVQRGLEGLEQSKFSVAFDMAVRLGGARASKNTCNCPDAGVDSRTS